MRSSSLIRLGSLAAIVGGVASTRLGLLCVLQTGGVALGSIENALLKGNYENPVLTTLLVGVLAGIAAMHVLQRQHYSLPGALVSPVAFVGVAMTVGANLLGELVPTMAQLAIILLIVGVLAAFIGVAGLGIVTMNTRVLPRWCGVALVIFGFLGLPAMLSGGIAWALLGLPWVLVGYALFQAGARLSERPSRVR
jgi:hypothetical protein